ncbi:MAG: hypothetical protein KC931_20135, partial [Candidatus Omnitrophica bacterium]|nr:hypothetical protein [Candidatus Omnitrophota bacterium]
LCPHCRSEYRSLKSVWDYLDNWETEEPATECEIQFSEKLREQFPSAFRQEEENRREYLPNGFGKIALAGSVLAIGMFCVFTLSPRDKDSEQRGGSIVKVVTPAPTETERAPIPKETGANSMSLASADALLEEEQLSPPEQVFPRNYQVMPVSLGQNRPQQTDSHSTLLSRHTVEINNHPMIGFSALSYSTEENAY